MSLTWQSHHPGSSGKSEGVFMELQHSGNPHFPHFLGGKTLLFCIFHQEMFVAGLEEGMLVAALGGFLLDYPTL